MTQHLGERSAPALEIEAAHIVGIEEAALDRRRADEGLDDRAAVEAGQIGDELARRPPAALDRRPGGDQAAQHGRLVKRRDLLAKPRRGDVPPFAHGLGCTVHRSTLLSARFPRLGTRLKLPPCTPHQPRPMISA